MDGPLYLADLIKIQVKDKEGFIAFENYGFVPRFSERYLNLFPDHATPQLILGSSRDYIYIKNPETEEAYLYAKLNLSDDELEMLESTVGDYLRNSNLYLDEELERRFPLENTAYAEAIETVWYAAQFNKDFIDEQLQICGLELFLIKDISENLKITDKVRRHREFYLNQILKNEQHLGILLLVPEHKIYKRKIY